MIHIQQGEVRLMDGSISLQAIQTVSFFLVAITWSLYGALKIIKFIKDTFSNVK